MFAFMCVLMAAFVSTNPEQTSAKVVNSTQKQVDKSKTITNGNSKVEVVNFYNRVVLKGKTDAIKKINKTLLKGSNAFFANDTGLYEIAEIVVNESDDVDETFYDYVAQEHVWNNDRYFSIVQEKYWYAGGVSNTDLSGYVFDLKTGKQIKDITKFTKSKKLSTVKKQIISALEEDYMDYDLTEIKDMKATDFAFFIDVDGNLRVCFGPYKLGFGGWTKVAVIPSKFSK